jgi:diguanylate cyclase (GGDEF)-like protein
MKILLVEDSRAMAALMETRLTAFGHQVGLAENGEVALRMFSQAPPDLILMDIEMPVMNGFEATNRIRAFEARQQWAWTPIIFLTASEAEENLVTAIDAGADDYIVKSASEAVLHAKMKAMARIANLRHSLSIANGKLAELASRDGLTGLYNRRHMDLLLDAAWARATEAGAPFGLLMIDVDNFKKYNDHYGHQQGDDCLRAIARTLAGEVERANAEGLTEAAYVARYGGEEFALILPNATVAAYHGLCTAIVEAMRRQAIAHAMNGEAGIVTLSIGGERVTHSSGSLAPLFRSADERLYQAKQQGRNRVELG